MEQFITDLIPILVPMIVAAIKKVNAKLREQHKWLALPITWLISMLITSLSRWAGVELPTDLANWDEGTVTALLTNSTVLAATGVFAREIYDQGKKGLKRWATST